MASSSATNPTVTVRHCHTLAEFQRCIELERLVWGGSDLDVVPLPLFVVTHETGGQVLGAFAGREMIGFTMAMAAFHSRPAGPPQLFLHSHMTAVLAEFRDRGVGRSLKLFQRQDALARGIRLVEWTFDPLETRNAYFNLMRLGAVARRFLPNCYGITSSPLHAGMPTDRLVAEWWLDSPRVNGLVQQDEPLAADVPAEDAQAVVVPAQMPEWRQRDPQRAVAEQSRIREAFQKWFGQHYVATAIEQTPEGSRYLLQPLAQVRAQMNIE